MKKFFVFSTFFFALMFYGVQAQKVANQVSQITGSVYKSVNSTVVDAAGNTYICGGFDDGTIDFGNSITLNGNNSYNGYIAKYDNLGVCQWANKVEVSSEQSVSFNDIAIADDGSIYIAGNFYSEDGGIDFGNGKLANVEEIDAAFIAKYDNSGMCQWVREICDPINYTTTSASNITVSDLGAVYLTGTFDNDELYFNNIMMIDDGDVSSQDVFVAKYDEDGDCQWAKAIVGDDLKESSDITTQTLSGDDYVYVVGSSSSSSLDFGNSQTLSNTTGYSNGFLGVFYGYNGNCTGVLKVEGPNGDSQIQSFSKPDNNFYIGGLFSKSTTFYNGDGSEGITLNSPDNSNDEAFIAKYNASGVCEWARVISGPNSSDGVIGLAVNGNSIYAIGTLLSSSIDFISPGKSEQKSNPGSGFSSYLAKYDTDGDYEWSVLVGGNDSDLFTGIDLDGNGDLYVGGYFNSSSLNIGTFTLTKEGYYDGFIAKFGEGQPATLATLSAPVQTSGVTRYTAISGAEVLDDGGAEVTERGMCVSENRYPDSNNGIMIPADDAGIGAFTVSIIDLTYGTKYYVRPYAINSVGVAYGTVRTFTTAPAGGVFN